MPRAASWRIWWASVRMRSRPVKRVLRRGTPPQTSEVSRGKRGAPSGARCLYRGVGQAEAGQDPAFGLVGADAGEVDGGEGGGGGGQGAGGDRDGGEAAGVGGGDLAQRGVPLLVGAGAELDVPAGEDDQDGARGEGEVAERVGERLADGGVPALEDDAVAAPLQQAADPGGPGAVESGEADGHGLRDTAPGRRRLRREELTHGASPAPLGGSTGPDILRSTSHNWSSVHGPTRVIHGRRSGRVRSALALEPERPGGGDVGDGAGQVVGGHLGVGEPGVRRHHALGDGAPGGGERVGADEDRQGGADLFAAAGVFGPGPFAPGPGGRARAWRSHQSARARWL
ncbi:hypothetical protein GA0115236_10213 [Streptomyces sp. IgraMP-1]|nr:hypothetical protein GA0115236_10213 [Streptomyces sp. IgraMP-1]